MNIVIYDSRGKDKYLYPVSEIHYEDDEIYLATVIDWNHNKQKAILSIERENSFPLGEEMRAKKV